MVLDIPCNTDKDKRILKADYIHVFKNFKICNICPKNAFMKLFTKEMKSKTSARFKPTTHRLLAYPFSYPSIDSAVWKIVKFHTI